MTSQTCLIFQVDGILLNQSFTCPVRYSSDQQRSDQVDAVILNLSGGYLLILGVLHWPQKIGVSGSSPPSRDKGFCQLLNNAEVRVAGLNSHNTLAHLEKHLCANKPQKWLRPAPNILLSSNSSSSCLSFSLSRKP